MAGTTIELPENSFCVVVSEGGEPELYVPDHPDAPMPTASAVIFAALMLLQKEGLEDPRISALISFLNVEAADYDFVLGRGRNEADE